MSKHSSKRERASAKVSDHNFNIVTKVLRNGPIRHRHHVCMGNYDAILFLRCGVVWAIVFCNYGNNT